MNNYDKYFGSIDRTIKTLTDDEYCSFCKYKNEDCDGECSEHIRYFLEQPVKTKKVRNCDLYNTPTELYEAFGRFCEKNECDKCKYRTNGNYECRYNFAYDYTEVEEG